MYYTDSFHAWMPSHFSARGMGDNIARPIVEAANSGGDSEG